MSVVCFYIIPQVYQLTGKILIVSEGKKKNLPSETLVREDESSWRREETRKRQLVLIRFNSFQALCIFEGDCSEVTKKRQKRAL